MGEICVETRAGPSPSLKNTAAEREMQRGRAKKRVTEEKRHRRRWKETGGKSQVPVSLNQKQTKYINEPGASRMHDSEKKGM